MKKVFLNLLIFIGFFIFLNRVYALEDGVYVIHSAVNDKYVLDANGGVASNGTNVQLWPYNGGLGQKYIIKNVGNGYYQITSLLNENYSLDVNGANFNNAVNIQLWGTNGGAAQKWFIKDTGDGYYNFISYNNNFSLDANGGIASAGTNIQLWSKNSSLAQKFRLENIFSAEKTVENGVYTISSALNENMVLDIYYGAFKNLTNIELYQKNNGEGQRFYVTYLGSGYYAIKAYSDINYALDVEGAKKTAETNVELFKFAGGSNQQWIIKDAGDGYYNIISKCGYLAIDVYGGFAKSGSNIQMYNYHNHNGQKFKFNKVESVGAKDLNNGYYFIKALGNSKKVFDVNYGLMEDKRNVELYDINYGINQKWYIEYLNDGYYKILCNKDSSFSLQADGTNVNIGKYNGNDNQKWVIRKANTGYYLISKSGKYIDIYMGTYVNNTNIQVYDYHGAINQKFTFQKTADGVSKKVVKDGIYQIGTALSNNMVLDVNGGQKYNGTKISLWSRNGGNNQKFKVTYLNNGYYKITTLVDLTKVIDLPGGSILQGANISIYDDANSINQQWIIKDAGDGYYNIISNCGGNYLDIANGSANNGTNVLMWQGNGGKNQKFKFIPSMEDTKVIDVSAHQGGIEWNKVYNTGIYGVILRIGTWETLDSRFYSYLDEVERLGLPYGIYLYSYASTTNGANIEANFTKKVINGTLKGHDGRKLNPTLGIYYDIEDWYISEYNTSNILSKNDYDNIISTYINNVSSGISSKYKVKVYANSNYALNRFNDYARSQVDWLADYRGYKGYKGPISLWQYTSSATLNGINGYVDMSYLQ